MKKNQWRTVGIAAFGMITLVVGLFIAGKSATAAGCFPSFAIAVGGCVGAVAAKAYGEHKVTAAAKPEPAP